MSAATADRPPRHARATWCALVAPAILLMLGTLRGPLAQWEWVSPRAAAWSIVAVTLGCTLAAAVTVVIGWRRHLAEVAILGAAFVAASILPLVHGLTIPGVLYGANTAVALSAFLAVPAAVAAALPILLPVGLGRGVARLWRAWSVGVVGAVASFKQQYLGGV